MAEQLDDRTRDKRNRILDAAKFLVLRHGLRATTMEAIAREARMAKPTLYAQFADKEAIFNGILDVLMRDMYAAFDSAMASDGPVAERVGAAIAGKYGAAARLLEGSPHAEELYSEHNRTAQRFWEEDQRVRDEIAAALGAAGVAEPLELTDMLLASANGIARTTGTAAKVQERIVLVSQRLIAPALL